MTKDEIVKQLKTAQHAHIQWLADAEALVAGVELDKDKVPLTYIRCDFGKWYYGEGQGLSGLPTFLSLEEPHKALHGFYHEIFITLFEKVEPSFLSKLFGNKRKHDQETHDKAKSILPELERASNQLVRSLRLLETEIMTMTDDKFARLFYG
jgi:hypothetical protein